MDEFNYNGFNAAEFQLINKATNEAVAFGDCLEPIQASVLSKNYDKPFQTSYSATLEMKDIVFYKDFDKLLKHSDSLVIVKAEEKKVKRLKYLFARTHSKRIKNKLYKKLYEYLHPIYNEGIKVKMSQIHFV